MYTANLLFTFLFPHFMSEIEIHTDSWAYRFLCDNQYMYLQKKDAVFKSYSLSVVKNSACFSTLP